MAGVILVGAEGGTDVHEFPGTINVGTSLVNKGFSRLESSRGGKFNLKTVEAIESALTGATDTIGSNLIPAGAIVFGVLIYVTILVAGCTSFHVGDGTDADKWGANVALTVGTATTNANFTSTANPIGYTAAANVVLTAVGGAASFSAGGVRAVVFYADMGALLS